VTCCPIGTPGDAHQLLGDSSWRPDTFDETFAVGRRRLEAEIVEDKNE
jgi:hypothetical protein